MESTDKTLPELFTASEFARFCQVDLKTIHNWADKGEIRHFRTPGRHLRFRRLDVLDFLRKYGYPIPEILQVGKPKVVVIDEDPSLLATLRRALSKRFDVTTFQDPFDALVTIGGLQPDAVVMDVEQKSVDGLHFIERLRAIDATAHIRCVVYSSHADKQRAAIDAGAVEFVDKADPNALRAALERITGLERA